MYSRSIIPNEFNAPTEHITEKFVLRPLTIEYVEEDYEVVMSSVDHLYKLIDNSEWPKGLSLQENLIDLGWHQREFTLRYSFAYTVMSSDEQYCLGCVYINPSRKIEYDAAISMWARESELSNNLDAKLYFSVRNISIFCTNLIEKTSKTDQFHL